MYTYCDLKEPYYLYIIRCNFISPRVIYDGWRSKFNLMEPLWTVFDAFLSKKHTLVIIGSQTGNIKRRQWFIRGFWGTNIKWSFREFEIWIFWFIKAFLWTLWTTFSIFEHFSSCFELPPSFFSSSFESLHVSGTSLFLMAPLEFSQCKEVAIQCFPK